jgi:hypothetical protein
LSLSNQISELPKGQRIFRALKSDRLGNGCGFRFCGEGFLHGTVETLEALVSGFRARFAEKADEKAEINEK